LQEVLRELHVETETCATVKQADLLLRTRVLDAVLVDGDMPDVAHLIDTLAQRKSGEQPRIIAFLNAKTNSEEAFQIGAHFVLYKPISKDKAQVSLAYAFRSAGRDRRNQDRQPVHLATKVSCGAEEATPVTLLDLSETGTAVLAQRRLPPDSKLYFEFQAPGQTATVRMAGNLVWQDLQGRAGIRFSNVPTASRKVLESWLNSNEALAPEPTVEQEIEVERFERLDRFSHAADEPVISKQQLPTPKREERRRGSRYRYGAGVKVAKQYSQIPNWCNIADISETGCYIEMARPFPWGTQLELELRTQDLRLKLKGTVRSSHPGTGMGLQFSFDNEEQQRQLQEIVQFLAAGATAPKR
jgi:CheY-like chemotaxis protein